MPIATWPALFNSVVFVAGPHSEFTDMKCIKGEMFDKNIKDMIRYDSQIRRLALQTNNTAVL